MKFKWFRYPVEGAADLEDLNAFLAAHAVISVRRDWVQGPHASVLVFVVEYADDSGAAGRASGRGDAAKDLNDRELALFNRLRDLRRQIAEAEAVPVWSLFGNQALRLVVKQLPDSIEALAAVPGVGKARAQKHGEQILAVLRDAAVAGSSEEGEKGS